MRYTPVLFLILAFCTSQYGYAGGPAYSRLYAAVDSAETAYANPAGMTRFDQKTTSVGFKLIDSFAEFEVDESRTTTSGGDPDKGSPIYSCLLHYSSD